MDSNAVGWLPVAIFWMTAARRTTWRIVQQVRGRTTSACRLSTAAPRDGSTIRGTVVRCVDLPNAGKREPSRAMPFSEQISQAPVRWIPGSFLAGARGALRSLTHNEVGSRGAWHSSTFGLSCRADPHTSSLVLRAGLPLVISALMEALLAWRRELANRVVIEVLRSRAQLCRARV